MIKAAVDHVCVCVRLMLLQGEVPDEAGVGVVRWGRGTVRGGH